MEKFLRLTTINGLDALPTKLGPLVKAKPVEKVDEVRAFEKGDHSQGVIGHAEKGQRLEAFGQPFGATVVHFDNTKTWEGKPLSARPWKPLYQQVMECWEEGQAQQAKPAPEMRDWMFLNKAQVSATVTGRASSGLKVQSLLSEMQKKKRELGQSMIDNCFDKYLGDYTPLEGRVGEFTKGIDTFTEKNWGIPEQQRQMRESVQKVFTDPRTRAMASDNVTKNNTLLTVLSQRGGKSITQKIWQVHEGLNRAADGLRGLAKACCSKNTGPWDMSLPSYVVSKLTVCWNHEGFSDDFEAYLKSMGISRDTRFSGQALDYMWFDETTDIKPNHFGVSAALAKLDSLFKMLGFTKAHYPESVVFYVRRHWENPGLSRDFEQTLLTLGVRR